MNGGFYYSQRYGLLNENSNSYAINKSLVLAKWASNNFVNYAPAKGMSNWNYASNVASYTSNAVAIINASSSNWNYASNAANYSSNAIAYLSNASSNWDYASNTANYSSNAIAYLSNASSNWNYASNTANYSSNAIAYLSNVALWGSNALIALSNELATCCAYTSNHFSNWDFASNALTSFYDVLSGSLTVGGHGTATTATSSPWKIEATNTGSLQFTSAMGTIVTMSDNFTASVLNFTGSHRCAYAFEFDQDQGTHGTHNTHSTHSTHDDMTGMIVVSTGSYMDPNGVPGIPDVNEALPLVDIAERSCDQRVFGVIAGFDDGLDAPVFNIGNLRFQYGNPGKRVIVNGSGEGAIRVCDYNGDFQVGDLITSSCVRGYGMRQADDIVHSYTVAKITCAIEWGDVECVSKYVHGTVKHASDEGKQHIRWALVGCVYMC
jgi:hypothetical protein